MRPKTALLLTAFAIAVGAFGEWRSTVSRTRSAAESLAQVSEEHSALRASIARAKERLLTAARMHADAERALAARTGTRPAKPAPSSKSTTPTLAQKTLTDLIANEPDVEVLLLKWNREAVLLEAGPFFRRHGFSTEQIRRYQDNYVAHAERDLDLRAAARAKDPTAEETFAALKAQSKADYEAAQQEVLGPVLYREMENYMDRVPVDNLLVRKLAAAAALEGTPWSAEQGAQVLQAAVDAGANQKTLWEEPGGKIDWEAFEERARQILAPDQFELFQKSSPPSGFTSRWQLQLQDAVFRALQSDAATPAQPGS
jgi:hypothetical protein